MTSADGSQHVLVLQMYDSDPQTHTGMSIDDCLAVVADIDGKVGRGQISRGLQDTERKLSAIGSEVVGDPDRTVEYYLLQRSRSETDELVNRDLEYLDSDSQVEKIEQYRRYAALGSALLYDNPNYGGSTRFFTATWPNFSWWPYQFNDRASSAKAWGGNILFQHSWYQGRRLYLIGIPFVQFNNLGVFGFDDIASSYVGF